MEAPFVSGGPSWLGGPSPKNMRYTGKILDIPTSLTRLTPFVTWCRQVFVQGWNRMQFEPLNPPKNVNKYFKNGKGRPSGPKFRKLLKFWKCLFLVFALLGVKHISNSPTKYWQLTNSLEAFNMWNCLYWLVLQQYKQIHRLKASRELTVNIL